MNNKTARFTLISIIALVVIVKLFNYLTTQKYIASAHIAEAMNLVAQVKLGIVEYYQQTGEPPNSNREAGLPDPESVKGRSVKSVSISQGGVITVYFNNKVSEDASIVFIPEFTASNLHGIEWNCTSSSISQKYFEHIIPACLYRPSAAIDDLMNAINQKAYNKIASLIADNVNVDQTQYGETPLMLALSRGNSRTVKMLLEAGADANKSATFYRGRTPLMYALRNSSLESVEALLKHGASINVTGPKGMTPLMYAARSGASAKVSLALEAGANPKHKDKTGNTALNYAASYGAASSVYKLINQASDVYTRSSEYGNAQFKDSRSVTALMEAATSNNHSRIQQLLETGAAINARDKNGYVALVHAIKSASCKASQTLIESGADINALDNKKRTPLMIAAESGNNACLSVLLQAGASLDHIALDGSTAVSIAVKKGNMEAVDHFISYAEDFSERGGKALLEALIISDSKLTPTMTEKLITGGANINFRDAKGHFPLSLAARHNRIDIAKLLLIHAADINKTDYLGRSALLYAAQYANLDMVELLLASGADTNKADVLGETPLMIAVDRNHYKMTRRLLDAGSNPDIKNNKGVSAMHIAHGKYFTDVEKLLKTR
ncbi:MAG: ankyrin repeat domain-containing protein [Gammaproteobacteria bacterium]